MTTETFTVKVNDRTVTAILYPAQKRDRKDVTLILAHGAGADQLSGFMKMAAAGLSQRGLDVVTFNFLYKEQCRSVPDPKERLESCYRAVIDAVLKKLKQNRLFIGGKSMGGRIASQVAEVEGDRAAGLIFLGYPLHPPGRPDKLRTEHLKTLRTPMLFCQGSRDAFGNEAEILATIKSLRLPAKLYVIAEGDHSFKVPKRAAVTQDQVHENVMDEIARWIASM